MDYMAIIDSTEESMKWHFLQLRGRQVMASIMGNCVSKSLHRESADEVRVSCAKQNNRSGVGSARAWLVHSQSWWRCCRSARWRLKGKSILFAWIQQSWQHCNNDNGNIATMTMATLQQWQWYTNHQTTIKNQSPLLLDDRPAVALCHVGGIGLTTRTLLPDEEVCWWKYEWAKESCS